MKKMLSSGLVMSALFATSSALAADANSLTTKGYVDDGLRAVYQVAKGAADAIGDGTTPGLAKDVATLQGIVGDGTTPGLAQDVAGLTQDVTGLSQDVTTLQGQVADKQAQLTNDAGTPADISDTVKTTVGAATGANAASDTALVTEKAVRDAIDAAVLSAGTVNAGTGITVGSNNTVSITGLAATGEASNTDKIYIFKNSQLQELSVATTWSDSVLTTP